MSDEPTQQPEQERAEATAPAAAEQAAADQAAEEADTDEHKRPVLLFDYRMRTTAQKDSPSVLVSCRAFRQGSEILCHVRTAQGSEQGPVWGDMLTVRWDGDAFQGDELPEKLRADLTAGVADRFAQLAKSPGSVLR